MRTPEIIKGGQFGNAIMHTVVSYRIKTIIEIGSGSGNGSTQCFIEALSRNGSGISLTCFEANPNWYGDLVQNTKAYDWVTCLNRSPICYDDLLVKDYQKDFAESKYAKECVFGLSNYKKEWYTDELPFYQKETTSLLRDIQAECVLIDGSAFSGYSEYLCLNPSVRWIMLDDVRVFKNNRVYEELRSSPHTTLLSEGGERFGWAIFKR